MVIPLLAASNTRETQEKRIQEKENSNKERDGIAEG